MLGIPIVSQFIHMSSHCHQQNSPLSCRWCAVVGTHWPALNQRLGFAAPAHDNGVDGDDNDDCDGNGYDGDDGNNDGNKRRLAGVE